MSAVWSERTVLSDESGLLPSRTPSVVAAEEHAEQVAEAEAAAAEAAQAFAQATAHVPLEPVPLPESVVFEDEALLSMVDASVAAKAAAYQQAALAADAALRQHEDTLRRMQLAAARMLSEMKGEAMAERALWDKAATPVAEAAALPQAFRAPPPALEGAGDMDVCSRSVRRLVAMQAAPRIVGAYRNPRPPTRPL